MSRTTLLREEAHDLTPTETPAATLVFDRAGARAVDRASTSEYGIPSMVLMEDAARGLADAAMEMLASAANPSGEVVIICGSGNNGGDGYALARHLHNRGVPVRLIAMGDPPSESDAGINRDICTRMQLPIDSIEILRDPEIVSRCGLIVDAIFGTGLDRPVTGEAAKVIEWINTSHRPVLAADIPSGLDCDTGEVLGIAVRATRTVTFVGLKKGFLPYQSQRWLGEVTVADIGAPRELLERYGTPMHHVNHGD